MCYVKLFRFSETGLIHMNPIYNIKYRYPTGIKNLEFSVCYLTFIKTTKKILPQSNVKTLKRSILTTLSANLKPVSYSAFFILIKDF